MRIDGRRGWRRGGCAVAGFLTLAAVVSAPGIGAQSSAYLDFDDLTRELRSIVNASNLATMRSLGTSHQGREIWLVEIADASGPPIGQRPGVLVVGNLSGDHLVGSSLALETVRYLVGAGASEAELTEHVIYVVPRLNPDGAEAMFIGPRDGNRLNALEFDTDNDGRMNEDAAEDLNGDGIITVMRVPDPLGVYMIDPDEPRLMKEADAAKGETGTHALYWEGVDNDGDGFINEDGFGGVDLDRHFQHEYPYWERDAGYNMVGQPEARALMDFVIGTRNIAAVVTFGHSDNLVTPPGSGGALTDATELDLNSFADASNDEIFSQGLFGTPFQRGGLQLRGAQPGRDNDPGSGQRPATTVNDADIEYFETVSEAYKEITGIEEVVINKTAAGAFFQYAYYQFGVPSFSTQGWALPSAEDEPSDSGEDEPSDSGEDEPSDSGEDEASGSARGGASASGDARILSAFDASGEDVFVPWSTYQHPDLGEVEIGGFRPYVVTNPAPSLLPELGAAHGEFIARLSTMLPRVRIASTEVEAHGGGVFTVTAHVQNTGYFPSALQHGVRSRSVDPVSVQIQIDPDDILTGASKTYMIQKLDGSGTTQAISWVIQGREGASVEIRVRAEKGGSDTATVTLR